MRVKDLRPTGAPAAPALTVRASAGAELLRLIGVLVDDVEEYDVGADRLAALRAQLDPELLAELRDLDGGAGISFHVLSLVAADLPDPAGVEELLAVLDHDPTLGWRLLLAHYALHNLHSDVQPDPVVLAQAEAGEPEAVATLRASLEEMTDHPVGMGSLLDTTPTDHGDRLVAAVRAIRSLWHQVEAETMHARTRDVAPRQAQIDDGMSVADIVLAATNGYELSGDATIGRIVLLPSFWLRPWLVVGRHADAEVLTTVVAEEFLVLPPEAPSPGLLRLFKALADESRLTLLRRMSSGPISLTEATAELDVAKATAHHHISILRQAGLVTVGGAGRTSRYALRQDPPTVAAELLASYLDPHRPTTLLPSDPEGT